MVCRAGGARAIRTPQPTRPVHPWRFGGQALTSQVSAASLELLRREDAVWALCAESGPALAPRARAVLAARPDAALCICGNVLALWPAQRPPAGQALAAARLLQALLECKRPAESAVGSSACSTFHPFYGWSRHGPSAGLQLHLEAVRGQLQQLWSPRLQEHLFGESCVPLATRPADAPLQGTAGLKWLLPVFDGSLPASQGYARPAWPHKTPAVPLESAMRCAGLSTR